MHWNHYDDNNASTSKAEGDAYLFGKNYGMNKDRGYYPNTTNNVNYDRLLFEQAAEYAVLQTAHEWRRLVALWKATHGPAAATGIEQQAINYLTNIYVDNNPILGIVATHQLYTESASFRWDPFPLDLIEAEDRNFFKPGVGIPSQPFHYVPIAEIAAAPAGAVMHIAPSATAYVGAERIGTPGRPLRLEKMAGQTGTVRLVK